MKPFWLVRVAMVMFFVGIGPACGYAQGGPPLLTDDPGTPGDGHWEINVAITVDKRTTATLLATPLIDVNYGLGERHQLKIEIPWVLLDKEDQGTKNGLGNSLIGWKWRFLDEGDWGFSASFYPQIEFNNPGSSSADRGLAEKGAQFLLPVQLAKGFGAVGVNIELGYLLNEHSTDEWLSGLALSYEVMDGVELLGEIHGTGSTNFSEHELVFNLGIRWKLGTHYTLLASAGRGIPGLTDDVPVFLSYTGVQFNF